jgi:ecdysteroid 25-hydroxylase CYP306A1
MWTLVLLAIFLVIFISFLASYRKEQIPGPLGLPILGHLLYLDTKSPYNTLTAMSRKYGREHGLFAIKLGRVRTVVLSDPKLIREALARDEFSGRAPLYLTHGIMHGYGECSQGDDGCFKGRGCI